MQHVKASNWSRTLVVSRYTFIFCFMVLSAAAPLDAQEPGRPLEPVALVVNADAHLKKAVTESILKEFMRLPGIEMKALQPGQMMKEYRWAVTIVVDETAGKDGSKNGGYVMAAAFSRLVPVFDGDKALETFSTFEYVPKSTFTRFILETRTGVSDLRSMILWSGVIREGFAGPGSEIAGIFESAYLPEIRRQQLQDQRRALPSPMKVPPG